MCKKCKKIKNETKRGYPQLYVKWCFTNEFFVSGTLLLNEPQQKKSDGKNNLLDLDSHSLSNTIFVNASGPHVDITVV